MMKVCDAADWFKPELSTTITNELREVPRLHRKQWEFAMKFNLLRKAGVLHEASSGISFGTGRELLIYSLANHVGHVWATDIYTNDTDWATARTTDINEFVRGNPLIPTHVDRISVKNMDMRQVEFEDESFDFAYSSSAVEHIGGWDDFRQHLAEVKRVLKPGGVYVMTTDISYGVPVQVQGNWKFTDEGLQWWLQESGMDYEPIIDCRIERNYINIPIPEDPMTWITPDNGQIRHDLFGQFLHAQMLHGRYPHSSVILMMRKAPTERPPVSFPGLAETKAFFEETVPLTQAAFQNSDLYPHPHATVPLEEQEGRYATAYMWLGERHRYARLRIATDGPGRVSFGVNRSHTDSYWAAVIDIPTQIVPTNGFVEVETMVSCNRDWLYSFYGFALDGAKLRHVEIFIQDARACAQGDWTMTGQGSSFTEAMAARHHPGS